MKKRNFKRKLALSLVLALLFQLFNVLPVFAEDSVPAEQEPQRMTPIMGWASWNNYWQNISEDKFISQMDAMEQHGLIDVGYTYFNVDDGYQFGRDDETGRVNTDEKKFPNGMKFIADYAHSKGMKAGIYTDAGEKTCGSLYDGRVAEGSDVGLYGYDEQDLRMYLEEWGYDFIKVDWCGGREQNLDKQTRYTEIGKIIEQIEKDTKKDKVYNICCWEFPGEWALDVADSWRTGSDISANFDSVLYQLDQIKSLAPYNGPGHVNDLDMLQVGNGMSFEEDKSHFSMWAMMSTPLVLGMDITKISEETLSIIKNEEIIALDQDPACVQATVAKTASGGEIWQKALGTADSSTKAVALLNRNSKAMDMTVNWADVGLKNVTTARDLWSHQDFSVGDSYTVNVPAHGVVVLKVSGDKVTETPNYFGAPTVTKTATAVKTATILTRTDEGINKVNVIASAYDENGVLRATKAMDSTITTKVRTVTNTLNIPDNFKGTLKIFYWNTDKSLNNPINTSYTYELPIKEDASISKGSIGPITAKDLIQKGAVLVDVRTAQEYEEDKIEGSVNLPHTDVLTKAETMFPDKATPLIVYCASAKRSAQAQDLLEYLGYTAVYNLGSKQNWETEPTVTISGQGNKYKFPNDPIEINYIVNQYDTVEVKYSFGADSTIADAATYRALRVPASAKGDLVVKAYLVYNDKVYAETAHTFKVYADAEVPDVEPFAYASDDMDNWITASTGWGSIGKDVSVDGNRITIAGKTYAKGIGAHAPSFITMNIPEGAKRFVTVAGCDDEVTDRNRYTTYSVYIDGVLVEETLKMKAGMSYLFDIEIPEGAKTLTLATGETNDYRDFDHTDWGIAGFVK